MSGEFKVNGKAYEWDIITYDHKYVPAEAVKAANKAIYSDQVKFMSVMGGSHNLGRYTANEGKQYLIT